jgi:hypothetical protein
MCFEYMSCLQQVYVNVMMTSRSDTTLCGLRAHLQVLEVTVVRDRHSGESKGFGFVRMGTEQGAAAALQALDNYLIGKDTSCYVQASSWAAVRVQAAAVHSQQPWRSQWKPFSSVLWAS